ncbi:hypothetical protein [Glycomyces buryatensis]|uniref:Uncharacterized protein n=1 Tax=Glycomyces buryatensis TaxID=2570927 RepID=A0A4S8QL27_9ACTN|nr:hypothetical protein [Glycomyces buryatensis]THV41424.1 hypothetical protein FAB82_11540 [Glycomyces buryatensis]
MHVITDRDPVHPSDDTAPQRTTFELEAGMTLGEAISHIRETFELPTITGGNATWRIEVDGKPVAVEAQQWTERGFIAEPSEPFIGEQIRFRYLEQRDPLHVLQGLAPERWGARTFETMSGAGKIAVANLWLQVAFGTCGFLIFSGMLSDLAEGPGTAFSFQPEPEMPTSVIQALTIVNGLLLVMVIVRAVLAVQITLRRRWARTTAITLEGVSIGLGVVLVTVYTAGGGEASAGMVAAGDCLGLLLSLLIVLLLATEDMKQWCNR